MSDPYKTAKPGRLMFKGGSVATLSKNIKKSKKSKKHKKEEEEEPVENNIENTLILEGQNSGEKEDVYSIDAAKKMNYQELFPVEARKFGYDAKKAKLAKEKADGTVEEALDDRVKKKADRYCK